MKRFLIALAATLAATPLAYAQTYTDSNGTVVSGFAPLINCTAGGVCGGPVSASNPLPVSASLTGFQPGSVYATPLAVSTTSARVALPAGSTIIVYNTGANAAYVRLGNSSVVATASNDVVPAGGWMAFAVGANGFLAGITSSGTTSLNISGGSGLPTGGAGAAGAVTQGGAASVGGAWPVYETLAGAAVSATNGLFVNPATGATFAVSAASLPLPTGAATAALQSSTLTALGSPFQAGGTIGNTAFGAKAQDGSGNLITSTTITGKQRLDVALASGAAPGVSAPSFIDLVGGTDGVNARALSTDSSGRLNANVSGNSGTPTQTSVSVGTSSTTVLAAATATTFLKLCVALPAATGVWVRWDGVAATAAAPSEYIPPGQCDSWVKSTGFLPTSQINAIASATVSVTLISN